MLSTVDDTDNVVSDNVVSVTGSIESENLDRGIAYPTSSIPAPRTQKIFRIIYVPDPTGCLNLEKAKNSPIFLRDYITEDEYDNIRHLSGFCYKTNRHKMVEKRKYIYVFIHEWVRLFQSI